MLQGYAAKPTYLTQLGKQYQGNIIYLHYGCLLRPAAIRDNWTIYLHHMKKKTLLYIPNIVSKLN